MAVGSTAADKLVEDEHQRGVRVVQIKRNRTIKKDSPSTDFLRVLAPAAVTSPSARHTNYQHLVLRLDKRPLADTGAAGLCLLAAVCPAGGRGAGAEWTRVGRGLGDGDGLELDGVRVRIRARGDVRGG